MKPPLLSALFVLAFVPSFSQELINPSFEDWTTEVFFSDPVPFTTSNFQSYLTNGTSAVLPHPDGVEGQGAWVRTTGEASFPVAGILALGQPSEDGLDNPVPFIGVPDSLVLWIEPHIEPNDTAFAACFLYASGVPMSVAFLPVTGSADEYVRYSVPFSNVFPGATEALGFVLTSTNPDLPVFPSNFYVDQIELIYNDSFGDAFPGGSLEDWTDVGTEEPDDWFSSNLFTGTAVSVSKSDDAFEGNYSCRIESQPVFFDPAQNMGFVIKGELGSDGLTGGVPIDEWSFGHPFSVSGYYKYTPAPEANDSAGVYFLLLHFNELTQAYDTTWESGTLLAPAADWTPFTYAAPFELMNEIWNNYETMWPDIVNIGFSSGPLPENDEPFEGLQGSVLLVDNLAWDYWYYWGIEEHDQPALVTYPNPASERVSFAGLGRVDAIRLLNSAGQVMASHGPEFQTMDVSVLPSGTYIIEVNAKGKVIRGRIVVSR